MGEPRICEILGVGLGQKFNIKGYYYSSPFYLKEETDDSIFLYNCKGISDNGTMLVKIINHPSLIEVIPKFTDEQKEIFKALKLLGFEYILCDKFQNLWATATKKEDKNINIWNKEVANSMGLNNFKDMFDFIKYEDEELFEIPEV